MSLISRALGNNFISRGLGISLSISVPEDSCEEIKLTLENTVSTKELKYPLTGTYAQVEGWKWNKTIPQKINSIKERIETYVGGHIYNLEEGSIKSDWYGGVLLGMELDSILEVQNKTKRTKWIPQVTTGVYSTYNFTKRLYSNASTCEIVSFNEETIEEVVRFTHTYNTNALESSLNIYMFKRDLGYNNIPYKTFKYDGGLNEKHSYKIDSGKVVFKEKVEKVIGTSSEEIDLIHCFDEYLGVGNFNRRIFYTEFFPITDVILKTIENEQVTVWQEQTTFENSLETDSHYIVDKSNGKIILNAFEKQKLFIKSVDNVNKFIEVFEPLVSVKSSGKININQTDYTYKSISKYGFYLDTSEDLTFSIGTELTVLKQGRSLNTNEQVYVKYKHVPRVDYEVVEGLRSNKKVNLKPYTMVDSNGIVEISPQEKHLSKLVLTCDKNKLDENTFGTVLIQSGSSVLTATALNSSNKPVEEIDVTFYAEEGAFEGDVAGQITKVTNNAGEAKTVFTYPYSDSSLISYSNAEYIEPHSYLEVSEFPAGITVNDIYVFQLLKIDAYYGSLGLRLNYTNSANIDAATYRVSFEGKVEEKDEYQSNQMNLLSNDPDFIVRENIGFCNDSENLFNYAVAEVFFNANTSSVIVPIKQIVGNSVVIYKNSDFNRAISVGKTISGISIYKKDEKLWRSNEEVLDKLPGLNRIVYKYNETNERYERLKPSRLQGNKIYFDNVHLPKGSLTDSSNIVAGYKIIMPRGVPIYCEAMDPATGITITSNRIYLKVDLPNYLKSDIGFRFKDDISEESSGLGGANFISVNPDFNSNINFLLDINEN